MRSTFGSISIALSALKSMQRAIEVTSHNVANVATPGYSRQQVALVPGEPYSVPTTNRNVSLGQVGSGVTIEKILRFRSDYIDSQIRNESLLNKGWEVRRDVLRQIEVALNEPSDQGIGTDLSEFWSAWHALAGAPDSTATRAYVAETASRLSSSLREAYRQMADLQGDLDKRVEFLVDRVNTLAHQIADLNDTIRQVVGVGQQPNDLRDQRTKLLDELSSLINVDVYETENNTVAVSLGGRLLVMDHVVSEIKSEADVNNPGAGTSTFLKRVVWADSGNVVTVRGIPLEGGLSAAARTQLAGELGGTLVARDLLLTERMQQLDDIANGLITQVNGLHQSGYDLYGAAGGGVTFSSVPNTIDGFTLTTPTGSNSGLADGSYYLEIRDHNNTLEFRMVDASGNPVAISSTSDGLGALTSDWQTLPVPAGGAFNTGRGISITFHTPLVDHSVSNITPDANVTTFYTSAVASDKTELVQDIYYVEVDTSNRFRLVDSVGNVIPISSTRDGSGPLTDPLIGGGYQAIPSGGGAFDTGRGLTIEFGPGPTYIWSQRGAPGPLPIPAASVTYTPRQVQLGSRGAGAASVNLANFFTGSGARDIALSDYIKLDHNRIAAASTPDGIPGDGSNALAIARLESAKVLNAGTSTINEYYRRAISSLGQEASQASTMTDNHELLLQHLKNRQEEVAGVSLDEEATSLIQYQRTYQAAARALTVIDAMLETLMSMGVVGR